MKVVSGTQMRTLDERTITQTGVSSYTLMERAGILAGSRLLKWIRSSLPGNASLPHIVIFAGKGNNGGDAFVTARFLYENSCSVSLYCLEDFSKIRSDALAHFRRLAPSLQEMAFTKVPEEAFHPANVLVDGLLGTGFHGSLRENYASVCRKINACSCLVASLDIPSGLNADSGEADPDAVCAHVTFTMAAPKKGMFSPAGIRLSGHLQILDIGIPPSFMEELPDTWEAASFQDMAPLLKRERFDTHKNSRGHVYVFGGSVLYPGAVQLASEAVLRSGAGLCSCFFPEGVHFYSSLPKALILRPLPSCEGFFSGKSLEGIDLDKADVIAAGPGMGQNQSSCDFLAEILLQNKPLVLDADALNLIAGNGSLQTLLKKRTVPAVLTPHPGEMKRLLHAAAPGRVWHSREEQVRFAAENYHCITLLKGARTLVAAPDGRLSINLSGSPALATAGSGDVLCGIIGAMLCDRAEDPFERTRLAVFLHGLTGELASSPASSRGCIADDFLLQIKHALQLLSAFAS